MMKRFFAFLIAFLLLTSWAHGGVIHVIGSGQTQGVTYYTTFGDFVDDASGSNYTADTGTDTETIVDNVGYPTPPSGAWSNWVGFYVYNVTRTAGSLIDSDPGGGTLYLSTSISGQTAGDTYYIRCQYDSTIDESSVYYYDGGDDGNSGSAEDLALGVYSPSTFKYRRVLFRINDISTNIGASYNINSAIFYNYVNWESSSRGDTDIYRINTNIRDWVESEVTSVIYKIGNNWTKYTGWDRVDDSTAIASNLVFDDSAGWKSITMTTAVSNWNDGTWDNQGMLYIMDERDGSDSGTTNSLKISSSEKTTETQRPVLWVQYLD